VGLEEVEVLQLNLYPNPATKELMLEFEHTLTDNGLIEIYDLAGKAIIKLEVESGIRQITIPLPIFISKGVFVCKATISNQLITRKFVIY
jgi:hypothetical protein